MLSALICFDFDRLVVPDNVSCIQAGAKQFARDSGANMGFSGTGLTAGNPLDSNYKKHFQASNIIKSANIKDFLPKHKKATASK